MKIPSDYFFGTFDVKPIDGKLWSLQNENQQWGFIYIGIQITPPDGMVFDFASIPRMAWRVIGPPTGYGKGANYGASACIHDYLYMSGKLTRKECDKCFLSAMKALKVSPWRRQLMFRIVRMFGKKYYNRGFNNPEIN